MLRKRMASKVSHPFSFEFYLPGLLSYPAVIMDTRNARMTPIMINVLIKIPPHPYSLVVICTDAISRTAGALADGTFLLLL